MNVLSMPKWFWWTALPLLFLGVIVVALSLIDEPLRAYAEREINHRLPSYVVRIGVLDLHPIGLSLDLENITVMQKDNPDPPIATISRIHGSLQWSALMAGRLVTDQTIEHPVIHLLRPQAAKELEPSPERTQSWQELVLAMHEIQLNDIRITNGEVNYRENETSKALHLTELNVHAENIRNVRSAPSRYPSHVHIEAVVFGKGRFNLDGSCRFLRGTLHGGQRGRGVDRHAAWGLVTPHGTTPVAADAGRSFRRRPCGILQLYRIQLTTLNVRDVKADFVHSARRGKRNKTPARRSPRRRTRPHSIPRSCAHRSREDRDSEFGFVKMATIPLTDVHRHADIELENWSNQPEPE